MTDTHRYLLQNTFGILQSKLGNRTVYSGREWEAWNYVWTIKDRYGIDPLACTFEEVEKALVARHLEVEQAENKAWGVGKIYKHIRPLG